MTNDFITMLAAGVFAVIVVFALRHAVRRMTGRVLPKWVMPACAGLAMLGVTIWAEYNWYPKLVAGLPQTAVVLDTGTESSFWRPWTYLAPITTRAVVLDRAEVTHPASGVAQARLLLIARWQPIQAVPVAYACAKNERADLLGGAKVNADGTLSGTQWRTLDAQDKGLEAACMGG